MTKPKKPKKLVAYRWEYQIIGISEMTTNISDFLNSFGKSGWEVITTWGVGELMFLLKRPLKN